LRAVIQGLRDAIDREAWYGALSLALALPDICAAVEAVDGKTSGARYAAWWDRWVGPAYKGEIGPQHIPTTALSGNDAYALRCSFLHQGIADIEQQRARDVLKRFTFTVPNADGGTWHCVIIDNEVLQLTVSHYARDVADAAEAWVNDRESRGEKIQPDAMLEIGRTFFLVQTS
jgi:hypothetical protein